MKKYDRLWNDLNNLLSLLRGGHEIRAIEEYFAKYDNDAPPQLLRAYIDKLEEHLNNAEKE